jgi:hypothetical protein
MTGAELRNKYGIDTATLLAYMKEGLQAKEPSEQLPVRDIDSLNHEEKRVQILIEMKRDRGQEPMAGLDPEQTEKINRYNELAQYHFINFDLPAHGKERKGRIAEVDGFHFDEKDFEQYHSPINNTSQLPLGHESFIEGIGQDKKAIGEGAFQGKTPNQSFELKGDFWEVKFDKRSATFRNLDRIRYLVHLFENPNKYFDPMELTALVKGNSFEPNTDLSKMGAEQLEKEGLSLIELGIPGIADEDKKKFEDIAMKLWDNKDNSDKAKSEWEKTKRFLSSTYGIVCIEGSHGLSFRRYNRGPQMGENARTNVRKHIKNATENIKKQLPALADHIERTVKTGKTICYSIDISTSHWTIIR